MSTTLKFQYFQSKITLLSLDLALKLYNATMIARVIPYTCLIFLLQNFKVISEIVEKSMDATYGYACTSLEVSGLPSYQGKLTL